MQLLDQSRPAAALPGETARRTLAMRIAHRNRLRAERLARLRPEAETAPPVRAIPPAEAKDDEAGAALEAFLRALTGDAAPGAADDVPAEPAPAAVLHFQRGGPETAAPGFADAATRRPCSAAGDLDRLPGIGPGLAWALGRAGVASRAELARLDEAELVARLGPIGRLVPARAWLAAAREA